MLHDEKSLQDTLWLENSFLAELYQCHAPGLFAYAYRLLASREEAEDIVLDVFLGVLQNAQFAAFDREKQKSWLWTITRNKVVDCYRRSARRPLISIEWLAEPLYEDAALAPDQVSLKQEEYAQLFYAVKTLPEAQQELLRLRFGHDLKCSQIAPLLKKNESAVRSMLYRSLRSLRAILKKQEKGEK